MKTFDLIIIGAGPGGYTAALELAKGMNVAIVDKRDTLGGTCLNIGCIPSKALLEASQHVAFIEKHAASFGIETTIHRIDFKKIMERKEEIVARLAKGLHSLFDGAKIPHFKGEARFVGLNEIEVNGERLSAKRFIIATGGETISLPFLPIDEKRVLSSTGALSLKEIPKTLLVVGAGVIGVELASVYNRLGTKVTVIEMLDRICPMLDKDVSRGLQKVLEKQGIVFHLKATLKSAEVYEKGGEERSILSEKILIAVGRRPHTKGLGLEEIGVKTERGFILVDDCLRTTIPHIFAIGDVVKGLQLAHRASDEGFALAKFLLGETAQVNELAIPNVIYTHPEVASVGLREDEAVNGRAATVPLKANGRALCEGETDGFAKVVFDKGNGRLLGLHILSPNAGEMIGEGVIAILKRMRVDELAQASHAHPTLSEVIKEAARRAGEREE